MLCNFLGFTGCRFYFFCNNYFKLVALHNAIKSAHYKDILAICSLQTHKMFLEYKINCISIRVIPCQINKEFRVTSRILTKLGMFIVPVVLITHANF